VVFDEGTEFGARVARRLREEQVVWLTTVTPAGAPLPRPVGFLWDGGDVVSVYSQPGARVRNIAANPRVTLNFDGDGRGATSSSSRARPTSTRPRRLRTRSPPGSRSTPPGSRGSA
jgi:PPOX class probable F420-dependent enzyme